MKTETKKTAIEVEFLVVYDNIEAGKRAKELCDRIQQSLGQEYKLFLRLWNMAALQAPSLAQTALETIKWPSVLVIALSENKPLPQFFKRWLSQCTRRPHPAIGAVIAQFYDSRQTKDKFVHAYMDLRQIASEAGITFLSEGAEMAGDALNYLLNEVCEAACMRLKLVE